MTARKQKLWVGPSALWHLRRPYEGRRPSLVWVAPLALLCGLEAGFGDGEGDFVVGYAVKVEAAGDADSFPFDLAQGAE